MEGSRGVDFKGKTPAHVILLYKPPNFAHCIQALGRGSRSIKDVCTGSIYSQESISSEPAAFLSYLEEKDNYHAHCLHLNITISKHLDGRVFKSPETKVIVDEFLHHLKKEISFLDENNEVAQ